MRIETISELKDFIADLDDDMEIYIKNEYSDISSSVSAELKYDYDEDKEYLIVEG